MPDEVESEPPCLIRKSLEPDLSVSLRNARYFHHHRICPAKPQTLWSSCSRELRASQHSWFFHLIPIPRWSWSQSLGRVEGPWQGRSPHLGTSRPISSIPELVQGQTGVLIHKHIYPEMSSMAAKLGWKRHWACGRAHANMASKMRSGRLQPDVPQSSYECRWYLDWGSIARNRWRRIAKMRSPVLAHRSSHVPGARNEWC